jgi:16S rRNA (guanine966-N2)-methyltransferase
MRILAGEYKGRKLLPPPGRAQTRPITGAVKKSLFDMLGGRLIDAVVVDLYCGTGTIGLEALSRGAARCCFAERDRAVLERLRRNIDAVGAGDRCAVWAGDASRGLTRRLAGLGGAVDLAFVDPPYAAARQWSWEQVGRTIFAPLAEHLADDGLVVLRLPGQVECPATIKGLEIVREKKYGDMALALLGREDR